ncbi:hypothetical protein NPIRD3C_1563 [Nitrosopumilus piranensis]|uniref:Uncharacterized protein n=1 Tax=Nitrosopumilus piranensis TaxID=1582439 RepID=A0A0C5C0B7_9ARCH|nr:hypothetical protein NPIRD3C_1563 [Nitrosopumilus piranensis]
MMYFRSKEEKLVEKQKKVQVNSNKTKKSRLGIENNRHSKF